MYLSEFISARRCLSSAKSPLRVGGLLLLILLIGCARSPEPPLTQAMRLFHQGDFNGALGVIDGALPKETDAEEKAELLALKGRCYWELAHRTEQPETRSAHLKQAVSILTESIEVKDNAESRHLRSLAYETLGEEELASADKRAARELDETFRRAYLNEKPQRVLMIEADDPDSLAQGDDPDEKKRDAAKESSGKNQASSQQPADWMASDVPSDPLESEADAPAPRPGRNVLSRARDVPWTSSGPAAARDPSQSPSQPQDLLRPGSTRSGLARLRDGDRESAGDQRLERDRPRRDGERPAADDEAADERDAEDPDTSEREGESDTGDEQGSGRESETRPPWIAPRPTWPMIPPSQLGAPPGWTSAPTTGLVGPVFSDQGGLGTAAAVPSAPTTGITGPPGMAAGAASPLPSPGMPGSSLPATATTGIGTAPLRRTPGAGPVVQPPQATVPLIQSEPQGGLAVTPQPRAGTVPQGAPQGFTPGFGGGIFPEHLRFGPHYNPLRPSPLTSQPPLPQMRVRPPLPR